MPFLNLFFFFCFFFLLVFILDGFVWGKKMIFFSFFAEETKHHDRKGERTEGKKKEEWNGMQGLKSGRYQLAEHGGCTSRES